MFVGFSFVFCMFVVLLSDYDKNAVFPAIFETVLLSVIHKICALQLEMCFALLFPQKPFLEKPSFLFCFYFLVSSLSSSIFLVLFINPF